MDIQVSIHSSSTASLRRFRCITWLTVTRISNLDLQLLTSRHTWLGILCVSTNPSRWNRRHSTSVLHVQRIFIPELYVRAYTMLLWPLTIWLQNAPNCVLLKVVYAAVTADFLHATVCCCFTSVHVTSKSYLTASSMQMTWKLSSYGGVTAHCGRTSAWVQFPIWLRSLSSTLRLAVRQTSQ